MSYVDFKNRTINRVPDVYRWIFAAVLGAWMFFDLVVR
jgi:hypothetical protein